MSKKDILRIPDYLEHIVEAIERIHLYVEDCSEVDFLDDKKLRMQLSETSRLLAKRHETSSFIILLLLNLTLKCLGHLCTPCATVLHMAILK